MSIIENDEKSYYSRVDHSLQRPQVPFSQRIFSNIELFELFSHGYGLGHRFIETLPCICIYIYIYGDSSFDLDNRYLYFVHNIEEKWPRGKRSEVHR